MEIVGNPDICFRVLEMCDVSSARELCFVLLASRQHRGYGAQQPQMWEQLTALHFGCVRHFDPLSPFVELPQVVRNPQWHEPVLRQADELSLPCREFLETSMEHALFASMSVFPGDIGHVTLINDQPIDCLVFPTNSSLVNFGIGAAGAIFNRAGPELMALVRSNPYQDIRRRTTDAVVTPGFNAGVDYLIHCVGPSSHRPDCEENLYKTYLNAFASARRVGATCVAVASISTGSLGFPPKRAANIALCAYRDFIKCHRWQATVGIVCYERTILDAMSNERTRILRQFNDGCLAIPFADEELAYTTLPPMPPPPTHALTT
ncbi:hypothetical protein H257_01884 [Aphanomyces astaci]|uniref:Macro domain-containing protein n=2 Tax=Aphanomyces astaci TaxID=112090 RepID=W4H477_APHAT|nr:hypothetical protein H257_01884 [Aphanomyces astaci]ETV86820.1 hypothetical protein H257_01884 [Aphanomyces astaci]|eukprot:XP_009823619.1 hypothetical protein H257_01884 [Aphanomyces astaci]